MFCELEEEPESEGRKEQVVKVDMQTDEDTWWFTCTSQRSAQFSNPHRLYIVGLIF